MKKGITFLPLYLLKKAEVILDNSKMKTFFFFYKNGQCSPVNLISMSRAGRQAKLEGWLRLRHRPYQEDSVDFGYLGCSGHNLKLKKNRISMALTS